MGTNLSKLRSGKGAPPAADEADDVIEADPRGNDKPLLRPLQVRVPETVFTEFSEQAGREFGFTHGAKK